jgi:hypothetical protein
VHAGHSSPTVSPYRLVRLSAEQNGVECAHERAKVNIRIHHDPVAFTVRPGDISIQAHGR